MLSREADFEELAEIGKGAFSSVYSCRNKYDEKAYALKKIRIKPPRKMSAVSTPYGKVLEEVRHLSSFLHPNVVRYYGCWVSTPPVSLPLQTKTQPVSAKKGPPCKSHFNEDKRPQGDPFSSKSSQDKSECNGLMVGHFSGDEADSFKDKKEGGSLHFSSYSNVSSEDKPKNNKLPQKSRFLEVGNLQLSDILDTAKPLSTITAPIDFYIQTELCEKTLKDYLEERNHKVREAPASQEWIKQAFKIAKQLVNGLIFLSAEKIIHRDIKPSNIFLDMDLQIKYGDFGLVKSCLEQSNVSFPPTPVLSPMPSEMRKNSAHYGETTTDFSEPQSGAKRARRYSCWDDNVNYDLTTRIGTTMYASPEQMGTAKYTKKSDYYSLGLVLVEVFHPMQTEMERLKLFQSIRKKEKIEVQFLGGRANKLGALIEGLLRHEPSQRIALDELLARICAEELRFSREHLGEMIGPVEFRKEGEHTWCQKYLMIMHGKLFIFTASGNQKAEQQIDLQEFKIGAGETELILNYHSKDDGPVLITFRNEVVEGFDIKAKESLASQILAKSA
jgi:translation initiation factor 2-alpha kinase 4